MQCICTTAGLDAQVQLSAEDTKHIARRFPPYIYVLDQFDASVVLEDPLCSLRSSLEITHKSFAEGDRLERLCGHRSLCKISGIELCV